MGGAHPFTAKLMSLQASYEVGEITHLKYWSYIEKQFVGALL